METKWKIGQKVLVEVEVAEIHIDAESTKYILKGTAQKEGFKIIADESEVHSLDEPLPKNATNGDMIKAMFPDAKIEEVFGWFDKDKLLGHRTWFGEGSQDYSLDWWNTPYKREEE